MKHVSTALIIILWLSFSVFGQPRRTSPTAKTGYPSEKVDAGAEPDPLADFPTKGLPEAHLFGDAASPELAKKAAAAILKNDENSLPALIGALQKAGFHLIDKDQKILIYCNNNFVGEPQAFATKVAPPSLNLSTYISLYTYGYRNVYELGPLLDVKRTKLELVKSE